MDFGLKTLVMEEQWNINDGPTKQKFTKFLKFSKREAQK